MEAYIFFRFFLVCSSWSCSKKRASWQEQCCHGFWLRHVTWRLRKWWIWNYIRGMNIYFFLFERRMLVNTGFTAIICCVRRDESLVIKFKRENGVVTGNWPVSSGTLSYFDVIGKAVDIVAIGNKAHCPWQHRYFNAKTSSPNFRGALLNRST